MKFHPIPQPHEISEIEKEDAMGAYFMMFATTGLGLPLPIINLIASVVYYYANRAKGRFVQFHSLQSLYSQIPITLLNSILIIWAAINFFGNKPYTNLFWGLLITAGIFNIIYFAYSVVAAIKAKKGRFYYFLFFGKLAYIHAYRVKPAKEEKSEVNMPPL